MWVQLWEYIGTFYFSEAGFCFCTEVQSKEIEEPSLSVIFKLVKEGFTSSSSASKILSSLTANSSQDTDKMISKRERILIGVKNLFKVFS